MKFTDYFRTRKGLIRIAVLLIVSLLSVLISRTTFFYCVIISRKAIDVMLKILITLSLFLFCISLGIIYKRYEKKPVKRFPWLCVGVFEIVFTANYFFNMASPYGIYSYNWEKDYSFRSSVLSDNDYIIIQHGNSTNLRTGIYNKFGIKLASTEADCIYLAEYYNKFSRETCFVGLSAYNGSSLVIDIFDRNWKKYDSFAVETGNYYETIGSCFYSFIGDQLRTFYYDNTEFTDWRGETLEWTYYDNNKDKRMSDSRWNLNPNSEGYFMNVPCRVIAKPKYIEEYELWLKSSQSSQSSNKVQSSKQNSGRTSTPSTSHSSTNGVYPSYPYANNYNPTPTATSTPTPQKRWRNVTYEEDCPHCLHGECSNCNGTGLIRNPYTGKQTDCPNCGYTHSCRYCDGRGTITKTKQVYE